MLGGWHWRVRLPWCATRAGLFVWERSPHHEGYILQYVIFKVDTLQDCVVIQRIACGH